MKKTNQAVAAVLSIMSFSIMPACSSDEEDELVGNWVKVSDFDGVARCSAVTFTVDGTVYIATGGYGGYKYRLDDLWAFNEDSGTWTQKASMDGTARTYAVGFGTDRYGYVGLAVELKEFVVEGLNEAGLSAGLFFFPQYGGYETYDPAQNDRTLVERIRQLDRRLALLPVATAVGTLGGALLAAPLFGADSAVTSAADSLAVGAGFGYYSLSSIFIADLRGAELATVALLCNILRELFTLLAAPMVARCFGPLAAVSIGGATTFDTTLPIITRAAGRPYAVVSIFHGCALDFSVPFLVTLFCSL